MLKMLKASRREFHVLLFFVLVLLAAADALSSAQTAVTTWHYDNARTSSNTTETLLTPSNVNPKSFGKLFTQPVDGYIVGEPLYLPGIAIANQGTHNVVFVATMHDSVYAFDADTPGIPALWMTSILKYSPIGATPVPVSVKMGSGTTGWKEVGIISTPVIDRMSGTLYLVAETYENGKVVHRLHALDVANGQETLSGPTTISATYTLNGVTSTFQDLYQMNRPGLLLANGHIYIAWGSNCCNAAPSQGWVMSYNATSLQPEGAFDVEPGRFFAGIWQKGAGISADIDGNVYAETSAGYYNPGTNLSTSVLKLSQGSTTLQLADWFTPFNYLYLSSNDLDLAEGVLILPDQPGPVLHEAIAVGKEGTVYVLNRDNMGQLCALCTTTDTQIVQELTEAVGVESGMPVYWNNTVYFTGTGVPAMAFTLNNGTLVTPPRAQSVKMNGGGHALVTSNGKSNGIVWLINGSPVIWALDALTLKTLYTSSQAPNSRDTLPPTAHFATPTVADGKVFAGTQTSLAVYGLLPALFATAGTAQSGVIASQLPQALQLQAIDPYSRAPFPGVTVTFSDGGKGGTFNPATAVTDQNGNASTSYTLPTKIGTYTLTASATDMAPATFTVTAKPGPVSILVRIKGSNQKEPILTPLTVPLVTRALDSYSNPVAGVVISYSDQGLNGTFSATQQTTASNGQVSVNYTTSTKSGTMKIYATAPGVPSLTFWETVTSGPASSIAVVSGNLQSASVNILLPVAISFKVTDQYGNPVVGASVSFSDGGAGGVFSANPVITTSTGIAKVSYTMPSFPGVVTITATINGISGTATETAK